MLFKIYNHNQCRRVKSLLHKLLLQILNHLHQEMELLLLNQKKENDRDGETIIMDQDQTQKELMQVKDSKNHLAEV